MLCSFVQGSPLPLYSVIPQFEKIWTTSDPCVCRAGLTWWSAEWLLVINTAEQISCPWKHFRFMNTFCSFFKNDLLLSSYYLLMTMTTEDFRLFGILKRRCFPARKHFMEYLCDWFLRIPYERISLSTDEKGVKTVYRMSWQLFELHSHLGSRKRILLFTHRWSRAWSVSTLNCWRISALLKQT